MPRINFSSHIQYTIVLMLFGVLLGPIQPSFGQNSFVNLDGNNDYIDLNGTFGGAGWTELTIEAWVYLSASSSDFQAVVSSTASGAFVHLQFFNNTGDIPIYTNSGTILFPAFVPSLNTWHHIAITSKSGDSRIYFNGTQVGSTNILTYNTINASNDVHIGNGNSNTRFFNGNIDEVRIWDTYRTQGEIQATMNAELTGSEPNLVAYYNFSQGVCGGNNTGLPVPQITNIANPGTHDGTMTNMSRNGCTSNIVCPPTCSSPALTILPPGVVPTLSQWGLIIFSLLVLIFGAVAIRSRNMILNEINDSQGISWRNFPLEKDLFGKILIGVSIVVTAIFVLAISLGGYELTNADVPGSLLAIPLLTYFIHLMLMEE